MQLLFANLCHRAILFSRRLPTTMNQPQQSLTLQELPQRRKNTELVSALLQQELAGHLETLRFLLSPDRALSKYPGARLDVGGIGQAYQEFLDSYKKHTGAAFDVGHPFDSDSVSDISGKLELYRWEYPYEIKTAGGAKTITMTSPRRWVLNYPSGYDLAQLRQAVSGREGRRAEQMRQFVINSLVLQQSAAKTPGLAALFTALRYSFSRGPVAELNGLPLVVIESSIPSFRPPDELILAATEFSGVPAFIELIDTDAIDQWEDPLKVRIQEILTAPSP